MRPEATGERVLRFRGTTMQSGIETNFNMERLMKAWRIDKETALIKIRAILKESRILK